MKVYLKVVKQNWLVAWQNKVFKQSLFVGLILLVVTMILTSYFFNYIENTKSGIVLNDWILQRIPALDASVFIVTLMGSAIFLFSIRAIANPNIFITFLFALVLQLTTRIITISITEFFPPRGLIVLRDPMDSLLYQSRFITRDLFYSGHTAIICLLYFCSFNKRDKYYFLLTAMSVGVLLLIQHVHYTIDVVCAPLFAFGGFWLSRKILTSQCAYVEGIQQ
jgi:PAP2 superfamily protein